MIPLPRARKGSFSDLYCENLLGFLEKKPIEMWGSLRFQFSKVSCCHASSSSLFSCLVMSDSLQLHGLQPTKLLCPWRFSRQEYWSRLPCPPPADLSNPGIQPASLLSLLLENEFFTTSTTWEVESAGMECFFFSWVYVTSPPLNQV